MAFRGKEQRPEGLWTAEGKGGEGGGGEKNTNKGITTRRKEMWGLAMEDFEDKQKVLYWIQEQSSVDIYRLQRKRTIALQKEGGEKELISFISFKFIHNHI